MPSRLATPVLTLDAAKFHQLDTSNVENLHGMWTVFSRCADSLQEGRRLENLSWRLWNRETFCCIDEARPASSTASTDEKEDVPELSASVESAAEEEEEESEGEGEGVSGSNAGQLPLDHTQPRSQKTNQLEGEQRSAPLAIRPAARRQHSERKHFTSLDLEKMVTTIKDGHGLDPFPRHVVSQSQPAPARSTADVTPRPSSPTATATAPATTTATATAISTSTPPSTATTTPVISDTNGRLAPLPVQRSRTSSPRPQPSPGQKKRDTMFMLGGSSGEDESSLEEHIGHGPRGVGLGGDALPGVGLGGGHALPGPPSTTVTPGPSGTDGAVRSSLTAGLKKKVTSFQDEVVTRTIDGRSSDHAAVFSDDEDDEVDDDDDDDDSVIDDDDEEEDEWEDSVTESGRSSVDEKLFQRVDSKPNLTSRRSLLTTLMHQDQRAAALAAAAGGTHSHAGGSLYSARSPHPSVHTPPTPSYHADAFESSDDEEGEEEGVTMRSDRGRLANSDPVHRVHPDAGPGTPPDANAKPEVGAVPIIMTTSNTHPPSLSPRTTRRNMLATELTESLRRHLLHERQVKNTTATAVLKRRHTAHNVSQLQEYPGQNGDRERGERGYGGSWNQFFGDGYEYNQAGW